MIGANLYGEGVPSYATGPAAPGPYVPPQLVTPNLCDERHHDALWSCPLHDCPHCAVDRFEYEDPEDYENPSEVHPDSLMWDYLENLAGRYLDSAGCAICDEILRRSRWAWYPGSECEDRGCLVCELCHACQDTGLVCRTCDRCMECAEVDGPCGVPRWDPRLRREVWSATHETYDKVTGRWG